MNENNITVVGNKTHNLKKDEYARWLCLIEAIDVVERRAAELKADITEFKQEINNKIETLVTKIEFNSELDKITLKLTIRLGTIMLTGIGIASATCSIIALLIKF